MRELLQCGWTPPEIAALPEQELERAILNAMVEREKDPTGGWLDTTRPGGEIIDHAALHGQFAYPKLREITQQIDRKFRSAIAALEGQGLIEAPPDNPSFRRLTPEGRQAANNPVSLETARVRNLLKPEMLHEKLRGKPYSDFANGEPNSAILEAFKIIEIEVKTAASLPNAYGHNLMMEAFDATTGPLADQAETAPARRALAQLFAGAMGRFRNPSAHTNRAFPDLNEAIEELVLASRLLRFLDEPGRK
jgi:uncharacterized protein (TIGR02391 family)